MQRPRVDYLRSMDIDLYPLLNLFIYLKTRGHNIGHSNFLHGGPDIGHQIIRKQLNTIFKTNSFNKVSTQQQLN